MHDPTLSDHLDGFLERARLRLAPSTVRSYANTAQRYLVPHLGDTRLSELTTLELERTYAKLLLGGGHGGKPLSRRSVGYAH